MAHWVLWFESFGLYGSAASSGGSYTASALLVHKAGMTWSLVMISWRRGDASHQTSSTMIPFQFHATTVFHTSSLVLSSPSSDR